MPFTMFKSGNTFGCVIPGFWKSSNDNTRPTTDCVLPFGVGVGVTCVVEVVGEAVVVWASVFVSTLVSVTFSVVVVELTVGVASELATELGVDTVTGEDWIVGADVVEVGLVGLAGFTGDTGFVGLVVDFLQVSDVVAQGCHVGCAYGLEHVEERVWVMLPV